jgi:phosphatidyl-myo-inositol dimannoside synthase
MRTLLLSPELFHNEGGIARIMRCYLKALCEGATAHDRIDSLVLNDHTATDPRLSRYTTSALGQSCACDRSKFAFIRHLFDLGSSADLAICGHLHQLSLLRLLKSFHSDLRYVLVAHGIEVWRPYSFFETKALRDAHRILCISEYTRLQMLRFCPQLDPNRLVVLPNTLDPFLDPVEVVGLRPAGSDPTILCVSRLTQTDIYKGVDTLIEALPHVLRERPGATLRIVGGGDDTERLRALADTHGVAGAVHFTGIIDDEVLRREYTTCDLFALPSRKEGFGLVYLEAMRHGKSCLAARAGGAPEVVNDRIGALADYGNIPDIVSALLDLIRHPRDPAALSDQVEAFSFDRFKARLASVLV